MPVSQAIHIESEGGALARFVAEAGQQTQTKTRQDNLPKTGNGNGVDQKLLKVAERYHQLYNSPKDTTSTVQRDTTVNIYTGNPGTYYSGEDTLFYWSREGFELLFPRDSLEIVEVPMGPTGFEGKPFLSQKQDWAIGFILLGWIIFASLRSGFGKYLGQVFQSLVSFAAATKLYRERSYSNMFGSLRLSAIFALILPLSLYQIAKMYGVNLFGYTQIGLYLIIFVVVNSYFYLKQFLYRITGSIIMLKDETREAVFNMVLYNNVLGLVLLVLSTVHAIASEFVVITQLLIAGAVLLFYVFSLFRTIYMWIRKGVSIFYLILYLCTLEILPILFVIKLSAGN